MWGEAFVVVRTPPCWFPSKQPAVELLEADVPPRRGSSPGATGGSEDGEGRRKRKDQGSKEKRGACHAA